MIETHENKINEEVNSPPQTIDDEWRKYNKHMDDMIDDAEIEAEMEAEKKIRSKNSRLFTISIIGIALLALVFLKAQQQSDIPQTKIYPKSPIEEATFLPKKSQSINHKAGQLAPAKPAPVKRLTSASSKFKNFAPQVTGGSTPKNVKTRKASKPTPVKQTINGPTGKHYVQLGAFSVKENAEKFSNKVKSKGFSNVISVASKKYTVRVEGLKTENEAQNIRQKLADQGFKNSFIR